MSKFDDIFSRKVKEAFDSYDADHLADEGWNSYLRKHGRKRSRVIVFPLWARAASIAVLVTAGVLFTSRWNDRKNGEPANQVAQGNRSELKGSATNKEDTAATTLEITAAMPVIANLDEASETTVSKTGQPRQAGREKSGYQAREAAGSLLAENYLAESSPQDDSSMAAGSLLAKDAAVTESLSTETAIAAEMSSGMNLPDNPAGIRLINDADTRLKLKPRETPQAYSEIPREKMTTTIMTGLSGMMASISNATSTAQGVSIGFYVEQQLSRRISVRPGLAMAKHNYTMGGSSGGSPAMDYTAPELNGMPGTTTSYDADIDVVSMEIPVNFVFSLWKRPRSNLFVSTGASTVVYLSQHMSANFNNRYTKTSVDPNTGGISYETMSTSVRIDSEQELLKRVDFMGLANFSAGYSLPFGKTSHLLFEPFIQLPMKDLTSLDLRIRYGGLSMKLQF